jgi:hypothetical protein
MRNAFVNSAVVLFLTLALFITYVTLFYTQPVKQVDGNRLFLTVSKDFSSLFNDACFVTRVNDTHVRMTCDLKRLQHFNNSVFDYFVSDEIHNFSMLYGLNVSVAFAHPVIILKDGSRWWLLNTTFVNFTAQPAEDYVALFINVSQPSVNLSTNVVSDSAGLNVSVDYDDSNHTFSLEDSVALLELVRNDSSVNVSVENDVVNVWFNTSINKAYFTHVFYAPYPARVCFNVSLSFYNDHQAFAMMPCLFVG